jgi:nucleotide-binding universal stress UspA family protein
MSTRILVPLDGSAPAEAVLPYGRELAKSFQADVLWLLTVRRAI